ncbi:4335_t:CDS:2 [Funneliformis geosporum]|uniref:4335_t:CDS:1 n=1 Tax=Funneliformis geosporum TaxID=1117311 RepID=A0A9W4SHV5_9GLOM|nr:4335_t:CDS:2 [Funneliformis geosporum]
MAQVAVPPIINSQVPTDEGGYIDESYLSTLTRRLGQEEVEDALSDISDFDEEWEELVQQMQQVLVAFLLPWLGRWLGRKFSFWAWTRFVKWYYYPRISDKVKPEYTDTTP